MITDPLALLLVIVAIAGTGFWMEHHLAWARQIGASMIVILLATVVSNAGLVAASSPVYGVIGGPVTSLAIVWLLLAVDLRDLRAAGPRMIGAFGLAVVATAIGALVATWTLGAMLGTEAWKLAGVMTGTYAGGSLNFVSVSRAVELDGALLTAATAADNVMTTVWMGATLMLPVWLAGRYPRRRSASRSMDGVGAAGDADTASLVAESRLRPRDVLALLAIGLLLILAADALAARLGGPSVVWLTSLALLVGRLAVVRGLAGALPLGLLALNLFFVIIGFASRIADIVAVGPAVLWFTAIVVSVHGLVTFGGARLLRLDVETAAVASQAAVGGPSTAMALAAARGWRDLALPGLIVGLLGYAVGTYAGLAVAALLR